MRKNSVKNTRINSEVLKELSHIIAREIKDPRISPMTTVVAVEVAPDLKTCKAYISVLGTQEEQENTLLGLRNAHGYIKRELARSVNLRNTPDIRFILDQSIEYGVNMTRKIDALNADLHEREKAALQKENVPNDLNGSNQSNLSLETVDSQKEDAVHDLNGEEAID